MSISTRYTFNIITAPPNRAPHGDTGDFPFTVNEQDFFDIEISVFNRSLVPSLIPPFETTVVLTPVIVNTASINYDLPNINIVLYGDNRFRVSGNSSGLFPNKTYKFRLNDGQPNKFLTTNNPYIVENFYGLVQYIPDPNQFKMLGFLINGLITCKLRVENNWDDQRIIMIDFVNSPNRGELNSIAN